MDDSLQFVAEKLHIGGYARHVLLCIGDQCCTADEGAAAWAALKDELKRRNLSLATGPHACYRSKVGCLRVCQNGPIAVVYPEGTWYAGLTAAKVPEFVERHLVADTPLAEMIFAANPLPNVSTVSGPDGSS
jgi:(2Fe-2S) ferredoxin